MTQQLAIDFSVEKNRKTIVLQRKKYTHLFHSHVFLENFTTNIVIS